MGRVPLNLQAKPAGGLVLSPSRPILTWPDPALTRPAQEVEPAGLAAREALEALSAAWRPGMAGLAAPQLGLPFRVFALAGPDGQPRFFLNPVLLDRAPALRTEEEGCYSLPGIRLPVPRPVWVVLRAQDIAGELHTLRAEGPLARVILHELDHLDGLLILDRVPGKVRREAERKLAAARRSRLILPPSVRDEAHPG